MSVTAIRGDSQLQNDTLTNDSLKNRTTDLTISTVAADKNILLQPNGTGIVHSTKDVKTDENFVLTDTKKVILGNSNDAWVRYNTDVPGIMLESDSAQTTYLMSPRRFSLFANAELDGSGDYYPTIEMIETSGTEALNFLVNTGKEFHFKEVATDLLTLNSTAATFGVNVVVPAHSITQAETYSLAPSNQGIASDETLSAGAGKDFASGTAYLASIMGNVHGDSLTKNANYIGGVIGADSVTGAKATTYPKGAVLAQITDGVTESDGAVVAYIDGDSSLTLANAAFKAMQNNSTPGSGFTYGLDLFGAAHNGYLELSIKNAAIRMDHEVCILNGSGAPVDAVTGAGFTEKGSLYIDNSTGKMYANTGSKAVPAWTAFESGAGSVAFADTTEVVLEKVNETPNDVLTVFTVDNTLVSGSEMVYLNGSVQQKGSGNDYTVTGTNPGQITFEAGNAPKTGSVVLVTYWKS
jgi:hypothetical protein